MAKIGLSKPYFAKYGMSGSSVVYSDGALLGKAITWDLSLDSASDNVLYADNAPAETENTFAGGSLNVGTDELMPDVAAAIFGVVAQTLTISGMATTGASYVVYDDDQITLILASAQSQRSRRTVLSNIRPSCSARSNSTMQMTHWKPRARLSPGRHRSSRAKS